jgi:hypothetical protein
MPNYQLGKIYKITSGDLVYIGSTCEPTLARRLSEHVSSYKRWKAGKDHKTTTSFQLIELGNYEITLIELCPCGSKDELTSRERLHIDNIVCVNKTLPGRTKRESGKAYYDKTKEQILVKKKSYRDNHKEELSHSKKEWYENHKEQILEQKSLYYETHKEQISKSRKLKYQSKKKE